MKKVNKEPLDLYNEDTYQPKVMKIKNKEIHPTRMTCENEFGCNRVIVNGDDWKKIKL